VVNENGERLAVILDYETYTAIEEELDDLYCQLGYNQAKLIVDKEIESGSYSWFDDFIKQIENE
jgi:hypothetical protein